MEPRAYLLAAITLLPSGRHTLMKAKLMLIDSLKRCYLSISASGPSCTRLDYTAAPKKRKHMAAVIQGSKVAKFLDR